MGIHAGRTLRGRVGAARILGACAVLLLVLAVLAQPAEADELSDVKGELAAKATELNGLVQTIADTEAEAQQMDARIEELLAGIDEHQRARSEAQQRIATLAEVVYKGGERVDFATILVSSETLDEMLDRMDMREKLLSEYANLAQAQQQEQEELEAAYQEVSAEKDRQAAVMAELWAQKDELDSLVAELSKRSAQLNAQQQAALAEAAAASHTVVSTFETVFDPVAQAMAEVEANAAAPGDGAVPEKEVETAAPSEAERVASSAAGWRTGLASAYGGSSDASTPNPGITATGARCDDWSVGVAVPMAWGPGPYYGLKVEISYGGRSVVATVNDCGGMNGGQRALDLQPGIFKALGFSTCSEWGVREVQYRFL